MPGYTNPQSLNRYSYVTNNPLRYIDPSRHKPVCGGYGEQCSDEELDAITGGGNGGGGSQGDDDDEPELILACGQGARALCDNTADYNRLHLAPYYQLSNGAPTIFGNDGNGKLPRKLLQALAIYYYIKMKPGQQFNLVGHSAGGTAMIIAARLLLRDGLGDQINNLVLLDPGMDDSYNVDEKGSMGNLQYEANLLAASGITVFLGDSLGAGDGDDTIIGAIDVPAGSNVDHLELANDQDIYNLIVTNPNWNP